MKHILKLTILFLFALLTLTIVGCGSSSNNEKSPNIKVPAYQTIVTDKRSSKIAYLVVIKEAPLAKGQLEQIGTELLQKTNDENPNLKNVFISFSDTDIEGIPYTYGQMQSIAGKTESSIRVNKNWEQKPTERDYRAYMVYQKYLTNNPNATYEEFANNYKNAPSANEIKSIVEKVEAWIIH